MLSLLLVIPLIGCLLLSFVEVRNNELEETTNSRMKKIALNTSLINLWYYVFTITNISYIIYLVYIILRCNILCYNILYIYEY